MADPDRSWRRLLLRGTLTVAEAAVLLGISEERVLELVSRMRAVPVRR